MKLRHWITAIVLLLLVAATVAGLLWTRELPAAERRSGCYSRPQTSGTQSSRSAAPTRGPASPADCAPHGSIWRALRKSRRWRMKPRRSGTTKSISPSTTRCAACRKLLAKLSPEAKEIADRKAKAEQAVKDDQENIKLLTRKLAAAPEAAERQSRRPDRRRQSATRTRSGRIGRRIRGSGAGRRRS